MQPKEPENYEEGKDWDLSSYLRNTWWCLILGVLVCHKIFVSHSFAPTERKEKVSLQENLAQKQQQQRAQTGCRGAGKWRKNILLLGVIAGVSMSVWWFWDTNEKIILKRRETLGNMCEERARVLQDQFNVSLNHVHALSILVSTFHHGKTPSAIDQVMCFFFFLQLIHFVSQVSSLNHQLVLHFFRKPLVNILREQTLRGLLPVVLRML